VNFHDLVSQLVIDTKGSPDGSFFAIAADSSLRAFLPELILCLTVPAMLIVRMIPALRRVSAFWVALIGTLVALYFAAPWEHLGAALTSGAAELPASVTRMEIFTGMLVYDTFSVYIRSALLAFIVLFLVFTRLSGIPDHEDGPDVYSLVLGATVGMCLMAAANHLLIVFLAVEMVSVPSYVLAGLLKGRRVASEASLKYVIYGAGTAGVMLYGISLVAGLLNTAHFPTMASELAARLSGGQLPGSDLMVLALGGLLIAVGLAFKLSAVPFHFWCPDVFEGATSEVNAFLSVASKTAALALLVRVVLGFGLIPPTGFEPGERTAKLASVTTTQTAALFNVADEPAAAAAPAVNNEAAGPAAVPELSAAEANAALAPVRTFIAKLIAFFAIITCTFGNLAAYGQTNLKRLFAYSTIAHAGYMLMAVSAMMALAGLNNAGAARAVAALAIYIAVYIFMNLGVFAVVAFLRNAMRSEEIGDYAGLIRRCPLTVICFSAMLFGLVGLPPLSGFIGKFAVFASIVDAYQAVEASGQSGFYLLLLLVVGSLNTALSLFYYLNIVKVMTIDGEPTDRRPFAFADVSLPGAYLWLITLPTVALIINWDGLNRLAQAAARYLFS
jgi:NADH-quinone oxidoreductase subunit N